MVHRKQSRCAYLDIETTGLSPDDGDLTVIGLFLEGKEEKRIVQLFDEEISAARLRQSLKGVERLYTYNGERFDLPFIKAKLGVDLPRYCQHRDLMYECWQRNLYGGLKEVERKLRIGRALAGVDGRMAVELWLQYKLYGDRKSLATLLEYNREDVMNLKVLRQKLKV